MAVYYKFKSAKDYDSVMIEGHFISVGHLKEKIFELKHLGRGTDFDLVVTNAQSNEEYLDEEMLIPKNTSVLIRRVPGRPRMPIVTAPVTEQEEPIMENYSDDVQAAKGAFAGAEPSTTKYAEELDWDEFGNDLYAIPETMPVQSSNPLQDALPVSKEDEDSKIRALIDTSALDWQRQPSDGYGSGRGFGRGMGGRGMMGGRGFGRGGFEKKTPPPGYTCHRCKVPGHFIQHCPTNGDPNFDVKRVKPPTGIPKSMLMATPDGSYALPSGAVAVLKPNEAAFEKEIEGMPSSRFVGDLPPELHCPLCGEVMRDAVLTSKCCFTSFCDKCIRDHIISKSMCVCGATNILADDLLPNKTLRDTINRILESNNNSAENGGSAFQAQDMESRNPQAKVPSPTQSAASKGLQVAAPPSQREETSRVVQVTEENRVVDALQGQEKGAIPKVPNVSEATSVKEAVSQGSAQLVEEEVQQRPVPGEAVKKKKKKKIRVPPGAPEMQWRPELAPENYNMMPMGPSGFNPYWNGIQPGGFDGFIPPYHPGPMPYMGYGLGGPMDVGFGGMLPHDPFGGPGCMMPFGGPPPQRDLAELAMGGGYNAGPPIMSREEFEARKANMKRKREMERREMERHGQREFRDGDYGRGRELSRDQGDYGREMSSTGDVRDVPPMKSKSKSIPALPNEEHHHHPSSRHRPERQSSPDRRSSRVPDLPRPSSKKKSDYHQDDNHRQHRSRMEETSPELTAAEKKTKASVFSRISFPEKDSTSSAPKKRKSSEMAVAAAGPSGHRRDGVVSNGHHHEEHHKVVSGSKRSSSSTAVIDQDNSSDDERHFKRRPSRYTSSPPPPLPVEEEEEHRHSRGTRERDHRDRDRGSYIKYR